MDVHKIEEFTKGWFVGSFEPNLISTDKVEIAYKVYKAGDCEPSHHHKICRELTVVVSGTVRINGQVLEKGDIVSIAPGESAEFDSLTDACTIAIKIPEDPNAVCTTGDKYLD